MFVARLQSSVLPSLLAACVVTGCAGSSMRGATDASGTAETFDPHAIPEELLLDVGIAVFDVADRVPDADDDEAVFQSDEVLRAERNYLPYVIGRRLQAAETWGAVRVVPRRSAVLDVTVTGTIVHSDGETLVFRARAADARGVEWFDREYRATAAPGAYDVDEDAADPFADAYAALAADMADRLRVLTPDDLGRIRAVAELAFARSLAPEAFSRHVTPKPGGGHELRRLPADEDPILARVREIRHREHLFIDQVNDYYDDFTARVQGPYDQWRREAFRSRRAQRELKVKGDAQMLLGSARIVAGLARMDHDMPGRMGFGWVSRGMGLIRGAEYAEGQVRANEASMREVGSSTEANLLPHTTALENRTATLQRGVDSSYDGLRVILNRLYREEFGIPPGSPPTSPTPVETTEDRPAPAAVDPMPPPVPSAAYGTRSSSLERRAADAKEQIRAGNAQKAIDMLSRMLDEGEELGESAAARIYTLLALGHYAQSDDRQASIAFNRVVGTACSNICSPGTTNPGKRRHFNPLRPVVLQFIAAVQDEIHYGDYDYAIEMVTDLVGDPRGAQPPKANRNAMKSLGIFTLRPAERVALYQALARAYVGNRDFAGAIEVYEQILGMGSKAPPLHREISNESLAMIYFFQKDYEKSLKYQRDWLDTSSWVGEACPKVCPARRSDSLAVEATQPAPAGTGSRSAGPGDAQSGSENVAPAAVRAPSGSE